MKAIVDCWHVFEMGSRIGHDMSLLDIRGGFSREEGSDPEFEEVMGRMRGRNKGGEEEREDRL